MSFSAPDHHGLPSALVRLGVSVSHSAKTLLGTSPTVLSSPLWPLPFPSVSSSAQFSSSWKSFHSINSYLFIPHYQCIPGAASLSFHHFNSLLPGFRVDLSPLRPICSPATRKIPPIKLQLEYSVATNCLQDKQGVNPSFCSPTPGWLYLDIQAVFFL